MTAAMAGVGDPSTAAAVAGPARRGRWRRGLFRKYVLLFVAVVSGALFVSGIFESWFVYREQTASLERLQAEQAAAAARQIDQFFADIELQMGWVADFPWVDDPELFEQRLSDAQRLRHRVPAITDLSLVNQDGLEQIRVSQMAMNVRRSGLDVSAEPKFREAVANGSYFGPLYYRRESEPYMTVSVAGVRPANGIAIAEVNLKFIFELVAAIRVGETGRAYVVDREGRLVAHPDTSLVLRNTSFADLPQVEAALRGAEPVAGYDVDGAAVITTHAPIPRLGWLMFVELPVKEALTPIYLSIARTAGLLVLGLSLAGVAGLVLARRMVGPIREIQAGAERIGSGDLGHRIKARTGDEIEALADQFNEMAASLQESRQDLERRVDERTAELAEKSRQLALASQHKSQFLANMSHELRTPLNAVLGYTELMLDNIYGEIPGRSREILDRVQVNGRHLLQMINDVLDLSKIEAGLLQLVIEDYDLGAIVSSVVASTESLARTKGLSLRAAIGSDLPTGRGDARRITQVVLNLVGNAVKFTETGFVEVAVTASGESFEIAVRDSGPGIDLADQERIFGEFQQVDNSSTRSKGGSGLGLAISKRIVELHGGSIGVRSKRGEGSAFRVLIPRDVDGAGAAA